MKRAHFSGLSNTPWREVASAIRLKRVPANKGVRLVRSPTGVALVEQLANISSEDLLIVGYQPAATAIANALTNGAGLSESLQLWMDERNALLQALQGKAEQIVLFDIDATVSEPADFAQKLMLRFGLEFSSRKSIALPDVNVLDLDLAERFIREDVSALTGHAELDHAALVPGRASPSAPASEYLEAVMAAREADNRLAADVVAFAATLNDAVENPERLASLTKRLGRSKLLEYNGVFGELAETIPSLLRAQQKEIFALQKTSDTLAEELAASRGALALAQDAMDEVVSEHAASRAALDEMSAEQIALRDALEQLLADRILGDEGGDEVALELRNEQLDANASSIGGSLVGNLLVDVLELSKDERLRLEAEIDLLRGLVELGAETSVSSIIDEGRGGEDQLGGASENVASSNVAVRLPTLPGHVVLSRKSLRNPAFWVQTGRDYLLVRASRLFDAKWYLRQYPELARKKRDPILHYLLYGGREGRPASPHFCSAQYMQHNPDVCEKGLNPLVHYLRTGRSEGRQTYRPSF